MPSGTRSSSGTYSPFSAGRLNDRPSTGIAATIVTPITARPRRRWPPSSVTTVTVARNARIPPREYVMPRHTMSTNSEVIPTSRVTSRRLVSVVIRIAIGIASTITSASAFQYSSGARRREACEVWLKLTPKTSTPGMILPARP